MNYAHAVVVRSLKNVTENNMKWLSKKVPEYSLGDRRIVGKFLFFPRKNNGEWRWLEFARWGQIVMKVSARYPISNAMVKGVFILQWVDIKWINE